MISHEIKNQKRRGSPGAPSMTLNEFAKTKSLLRRHLVARSKTVRLPEPRYFGKVMNGQYTYYAIADLEKWYAIAFNNGGEK